MVPLPPPRQHRSPNPNPIQHTFDAVSCCTINMSPATGFVTQGARAATAKVLRTGHDYAAMVCFIPLHVFPQSMPIGRDVFNRVNRRIVQYAPAPPQWGGAR